MENTIELLGHYGGDTTHALSAWTSTYRELTPEKEERVPNLLAMLASAGHHTPFEKSSLHFLIRCDDATHIQILKHRIGVSINAESARYKELKEPTCYVPDDWGSVEVANMYREEFTPYSEMLEDHFQNCVELYHRAVDEFTPKMGRKRAKESARFFLPKCNQITMDVMFNWRSFAHFLSLRNKPDSQLEIRELAEKALELVRNIEGEPFKQTIKSFKY